MEAEVHPIDGAPAVSPNNGAFLLNLDEPIVFATFVTFLQEGQLSVFLTQFVNNQQFLPALDCQKSDVYVRMFTTSCQKLLKIKLEEVVPKETLYRFVWYWSGCPDIPEFGKYEFERMEAEVVEREFRTFWSEYIYSVHLAHKSVL